MILADTASLGLALWSGRFAQHAMGGMGPVLHDPAIASGCLVLIGNLIGRDHYSRTLGARAEVDTLVLSALLAGLCGLCVTLLSNQRFELAQAVVLLIVVPLIILGRCAARMALMRCALIDVPMALIGDAEQVEQIGSTLRTGRSSGFCLAASANHDEVATVSDAAAWAQLALDRGVRLVVVAPDAPADLDRSAMVSTIRRAGLPCAVLPGCGTLRLDRWRMDCLVSHQLGLMIAKARLQGRVSFMLKRIVDVAIASVMIVLLSPLLIAIAVLVRSDRGPALFHHPRLGVGGSSFNCIKFRSMRLDAAAALADLLSRDAAAATEWAATQKLRCDPRVTPVGHFLRKTSLDELPQLLNVLRGDMSLVGPRPIVAAEARFYGDCLSDYQRVRPGVTGLWQVSGRSDTSYAERVMLDVRYVADWSLWHDLRILMRTVPVVLLRRGAV